MEPIQLPVVDFGVFSLDSNIQCSNQELQKLANELTDGFRTNGVVLLKNTGYKDDLITEAWDSFDQFRALPSETKDRYVTVPFKEPNFQVPIYARPGTDRGLDREPDSVECLNLFRLIPGTVYPEVEVPGITQNLNDLWRCASSLLERCIQCLALGLGVNMALFDDVMKGYLQEKEMSNVAQLRLNYYKPWSDLDEDQRTKCRMTAHRDVTLLTLIKSDEPGLQIEDSEGNWVNVPVIPGTCVVQAGSSLEQMVGRVIRAPRHRVMYIDSPEMQRRSTICFIYPDSATPLHAVMGEARPPINLCQITKIATEENH